MEVDVNKQSLTFEFYGDKFQNIDINISEDFIDNENNVKNLVDLAFSLKLNIDQTDKEKRINQLVGFAWRCKFLFLPDCGFVCAQQRNFCIPCPDFNGMPFGGGYLRRIQGFKIHGRA